MTERTLEQAIANAMQRQAEIPYLIQPSASDFDIVTLANEVMRLQEVLETFRRDRIDDNAKLSRYKEGIVRIRAHTALPPCPSEALMRGLLKSIERIADNTLSGRYDLAQILSSCVKDQDESGIGSRIICGSVVRAFSTSNGLDVADGYSDEDLSRLDSEDKPPA